MHDTSSLVTALNILANVNFGAACACGQLKKAKKMLKSGKVDEVWFSIGEGFLNACWGGRMKVAKWLFHSNPRRDWDEELAYASTCIYGHVNVTKWLQRLYPALRGSRKRELQLVSFF
jgi:hypothetical protein